VKGQLQQAQPRHMFLSDAALGHLQRRCPRVVDFLRDFRPLPETPRGRWFSGS
jgi:hypothetical protein